VKLSFDWLSDFVDLSGLSAHEVAEKLTMGAFEVEEVTSFGPDISGPLVVGEILEIHPHPNADKIRLTKTRVAEGEEGQEIVCGAWNIEVGHKIPVALPGARVINRHDNSALEIKAGKIRGVVSNGMLCSAPELGIAGSGEGILLLPPDTRVGIDAKEVLGLKNDYVLHVEPRSNRGDALSVLGLAREVAALLGRPLKKLDWLEEFKAMKENAEEVNSGELGWMTALSVEIADPADCPYFTVQTLGDIKIAPSDAMISRRLEAIGVKSINNVVDITNYVLHELGQPLHAYDLSRLKGEKLSVRRAQADERILTIDQKERKLSEDALVIADGESVVGVAGVMGGKLSEVSDDTTAVALEAASFASARVRRSSRTLGLSSDSSLRFERGVDTGNVRLSSNRASYLLVKYAGAKLGKMAAAGSDTIPEVLVSLRMSELKRICEIDMSAGDAVKMLEPLGFQGNVISDPSRDPASNSAIAAAAENDAAAKNVDVIFSIPSFRQKDVSREIDIVEELVRLWGYDKLPVSMPASTIAARVPDPLPAKVRMSLASTGLSEAWLSSLTGLEDLSGRKSFATTGDNAVSVQNPLSAEHQVLRQSLIPGLLKAASYNQDRGNATPCLFEIGKSYRHEPRRFNKQLPPHKQTSTLEEGLASAIVCGEPSLSQWMSTGKQEDSFNFYLIKGILENLLTSFAIPLSSLRLRQTEDIPGWFHPGRSAACFIDMTASGGESDKSGNKKQKSGKKSEMFLAYLGEIHPAVADAYRVAGRAAAFEVSLSALAELMPDARFSEIYLTPVIQRDLTCDLDTSVRHEDLLQCIRGCGEETLQKVVLVSLFKLSDSKKSLSYRLTFQHPSQTLTADSVDAVMNKLREDLTKTLNASFRL
jgi:phenylalanyl-tRNA synthetase beta chain